MHIFLVTNIAIWFFVLAVVVLVFVLWQRVGATARVVFICVLAVTYLVATPFVLAFANKVDPKIDGQFWGWAGSVGAIVGWAVIPFTPLSRPFSRWRKRLRQAQPAQPPPAAGNYTTAAQTPGAGAARRQYTHVVPIPVTVRGGKFPRRRNQRPGSPLRGG